jgi:uncharacterized protein YprB with RNaseH-like and TPR domain
MQINAFSAPRPRDRITGMLRNTFLHIPGIGPRREHGLHSRGIRTWDKFMADPDRSGLSKSLAHIAAEWLEESFYRLGAKDAAFFAGCLPPGERWRLWDDFQHEAVFLDIETTGLGPPIDYVTVVGLHDAAGTHSYVRGENLFMFPEAIGRYRLIVTFNGAQFDLPFLRARMGDIFENHAHIDLRFVLRKLGYRGGLKSIEKQLGIRRPDELEGMDGFEAVRLWQNHLRGMSGSLEKLVAYNRQDVENLRPLISFAYEALRASALQFRR